MNIRTKLILSVGVLAGMIILLVALSVVNLQILTATEPDSPAAVPGLQRFNFVGRQNVSVCR